MRAIVLAAGKGTRMKSGRPKVLHDICGRPMLWHVLRALRAAGVNDIVVVAGDQVAQKTAQFGVTCVLQTEPRGTGHAVRIALEAMPSAAGPLLVAYGDMPLIPEGLIVAARRSLDGERATALALVTVRMPLPSSFGRVVREADTVRRIVEAADATPDELAIDEMNAGLYAFDETELREAIPRLSADNAQGEYYLTDTVGDLIERGKTVRPILANDSLDVLGINDRIELARARREMNARLCERHMRDGVTIVDPQTCYLEPELTIGRDTVIYPNTTISRLSEIGGRCTIGPNARLSNVRLGDEVTVTESVVMDAVVGNGAIIGPFAHVRGDCTFGDGVRIGNFVEVKKSALARGVKAAHLSYLGDAHIGEDTNVGAGTITCNYDGEKKNETIVGAGVRIGSNSSLIAPLRIGDGALTGAGSVVTHDIPPGGRVAGNPARPLPPKKRD